MPNTSKQKGTRAETNVVRFLAAHGIDAHRKALTGSKDCGDVEVHAKGLGQVVLEVKTGKQTANPTRSQIDKWMDQARVEGSNSGLPWYLCIVRFNRSIGDADMYTEREVEGEVIVEHLYLDEFAKRCV